MAMDVVQDRYFVFTVVLKGRKYSYSTFFISRNRRRKIAMKCQLHLEREAVGFCQNCKAPLCAECDNTFASLCMNCAEKTVSNGRKEILITFGISIIAFLLGLRFQIKGGYFREDSVHAIISCILMLFLPFGWKGISRITDYLLVIASALGFFGMLLYFVLKFAFALFLGWIFAIPKIIEMIKLWKTYGKLENNVKAMKMIPKSRYVNE